MMRVPSSAAVNHALAAQPRGAAVELPMITQADGGGLWAAVETKRMWLAGIDGHPRVNGYSGYQPKGFDALGKTLNAGASTALPAVMPLGVRYVVLHVENASSDTALRVGAFTSDRAQAWMATLPASARVVGKYGDAWLIDLSGVPQTHR